MGGAGALGPRSTLRIMLRVFLPRDAGLHRRARDRGRLVFVVAWVVWFGVVVFWLVFEVRELVGGGHFLRHGLAREFAQRAYRGNLHGLIDAARTHGERATEDERKAQHVIHLVGVVAAACRAPTSC